MGNLAIVLLLVCILSSFEAVQGYAGPRGSPCQYHSNCLPPAVCDNGRCKEIPCKDNSVCPGILTCYYGMCEGNVEEDDINRLIGTPCKNIGDCYFNMVCQNGSCQKG
uniref:Putative secreted protein n=2 Tax=Ixodes ricinus TaxID=34613 RepID=V5HFI2_IXORI